MNKLLEITNKKILNLSKKIGIIAFIFCISSFLFIYLYYQNYNPKLLLFSFLMFKIGLTIKVASIMSSIFIQKYIT